MLVQTVCEWDDKRAHGEPYLLDSMPLVYVSDDATAPNGTWTDAKWKTAHAYWGEYRDFFNVPTVGDRPISRHLSLDLDNITALTSANGLNSVKKIAIGVQIETSNDWGIDISAATLGGATALGFADRIGSIEVGKQADLVCVDLGQLETQPLHNVISQLVYATGRHQVSDVWIAGVSRLENRVLVDMDIDGIMANARQWRERIASVRG